MVPVHSLALMGICMQMINDNRMGPFNYVIVFRSVYFNLIGLLLAVSLELIDGLECSGFAL